MWPPGTRCAPRGTGWGAWGCEGAGAQGLGWASGPRADASPQALQQYAACQSHAFMKGIGSFLAGTGRSSHPGIPRAVLGRSPRAVGTSRPCPVTLAPVSAGSGAAFAVQKLVRQTLPYSPKWNLLLAAGKCPTERYRGVFAIVMGARLWLQPPPCAPGLRRVRGTAGAVPTKVLLALPGAPRPPQLQGPSEATW